MSARLARGGRAAASVLVPPGLQVRSPLLRGGLQALLRVRRARGQHHRAARRPVQRAQVQRNNRRGAQRSHAEERQAGELKKSEEKASEAGRLPRKTSTRESDPSLGGACAMMDEVRGNAPDWAGSPR
jgi:hypothetical protein